MKTKLMRKDTQKIRVLGEEDGRVLMIDCLKPTMPKWIRQEEIEEYVLVEEKMKEDVDGLECEISFDSFCSLVIVTWFRELKSYNCKSEN